jgi:hypothetical protein
MKTVAKFLKWCAWVGLMAIVCAAYVLASPIIIVVLLGAFLLDLPHAITSSGRGPQIAAFNDLCDRIQEDREGEREKP